jgi:hypothetical protein
MRQWARPPEGREGRRRKAKEDVLPVYILQNGLAHLKAEKDEVEGQEDDLPVSIRDAAVISSIVSKQSKSFSFC